MANDRQTAELDLSGRTIASYPWLAAGLGPERSRLVDWPALPVMRDMLRSEIAAQLHELATPCPDHGRRIEVRCPACVQLGITLRCASIAAGDTCTMPAMPPASVMQAYDSDFAETGAERPRPSLLSRLLNHVRRTS